MFNIYANAFMTASRTQTSNPRPATANNDTSKGR